VLSTSLVTPVIVDLHGEGGVGYVLPRTMRDDGMFVGELQLWPGRSFTGSWAVKDTDTVPVRAELVSRPRQPGFRE
jgi:hypothetical protein